MKNGITALLASLFAIIFASSASAQTWPTMPSRFVVPFAAGGANDLMARSAAEGAGGTLGSDIVAKAAPDGCTFLISAASLSPCKCHKSSTWS